jgi:glutaminase
VSSFFHNQLSKENGLANGRDFASYLRGCGILPDDPRFTSLHRNLLVNSYEYKSDITLEQFTTIVKECSQYSFLERAFRQKLVVSDFQTFKSKIIELFKEVRESVPATNGLNAQYIPQLAKVDSNLFSISGKICSNYKVCTIDGQRISFGDTDAKWCVQSCIKPLIYAMALEEHGEEKVHQHIGNIYLNY